MISKIAAAIGAIVFILTPITAQASRVSPMIVALEPVGRGSITRIELTNDSDRDIPYEVLMMRGEISPDGKLALKPADDEFLLFPTQTIVEANSQQVFRAQYVGEAALDKSQIYYMSIRQVPVEFEGEDSQVQVVVNYNVLINVVPDGALPTPVVLGTKVTTRLGQIPEGEAEKGVVPPTIHGVEVDVGNEGNRFFLAGYTNWTVSGRTVAGDPFETKIGNTSLSNLIGVGVVAPGRNRLFFIPTETPLEEGSVTVEIKP
ncbi:hypothetical protein [Parasphingorhabdus flavimaris]|uniref:hypothetical protein n=1 Tax=Parasphingorhabdus flavimaris TaxID=266812 RepID=UPI0030016642